jgi:rhamnulokinase
MKPATCVAVDLGATSGRVVVGVWHERRLDTYEVHRFPNKFRSLGSQAYWDVPFLWEEVRKGLADAKDRFENIVSVGVDTWAVDHVLVNAKGRLVYPVHSYRDSRTQGLSAELDRNGLERIYALTGVPNYAYNTSLQLKETLESCPAIADAASRCLFLSDYFNFLISGRMENEFSICSHSQLINVAGKTWSRDAFEFFGIPRHWFSKPALSPARLGPVTGLPGFGGVQSILVPGHDTACAYAAMPAAEDGSDLYLSSGTWSLLGFESKVPLTGLEALKARVSNERMGNGGYRPLRSCLGLWLLEQTLPHFTSRPANPMAWERLILDAAMLPPPKILIDVTDPTLFNPPNMRAAIDGQLRKARAKLPRNLAGYMRLICDSLGRGHAQAVGTFERLAKRKFKRILMVGGGSKNSLLCQSTADAAQLPVVSFSLEGAAVGNLGSQIIALGAVEDLATFRRDIGSRLEMKTYQPRN